MINIYLAIGLVLLFGFVPQSNQTKKACKSPYYGMGNGDGVYDRRCFLLQSQLSKAAWAGDVERIKLLRNGANADSYAGEYIPPCMAQLPMENGSSAILLDHGANINREYTLMAHPYLLQFMVITPRR